MPDKVINPNAFGVTALAGPISRGIHQVLADGELFRHRSDGQRSWNDRLEHGLADWSGCPTATAVSSGTAGLRLALHALGVRPGDRVLISAYTFVATAMAVVALGAVPEPLDVDARLGVDVEDLERRLHPAVRAVVVVHVQGHLADLGHASELLRSRGVPLVEDACQAVGASVFGRPAGSVGDAGVFSFQQAKQLASGEGGAIVSRHRDVVRDCARRADLGATRGADGRPDWDHEDAVLGENARLSELQAALLCGQLDALPEALARQRGIRSQVGSMARDTEVPVLNSRDSDGDSGSHLLIMAASPEHGAAMIEDLRRRAVLARLVWDRPYYAHRAFRRANLTPEQLNVPAAPHAERVAPRLVSLPMSPVIPDERVGELGTAVIEAWRATRSVAA